MDNCVSNNQIEVSEKLTESLYNLSTKATNAIEQEYDNETTLIDNDPKMTTDEKISAYRQSLSHYVIELFMLVGTLYCAKTFIDSKNSRR